MLQGVTKLKNLVSFVPVSFGGSTTDYANGTDMGKPEWSGKPAK